MIRNMRDRDLGLPVLTVFLALWCAAVFLMINAQGVSNQTLARWGAPSDSAIYDGAVWGLITSAFVHVEPIHLIFNLYWLYMLGGALERSVGPLRWLAFVLAATFVSSGLELLSGTSGIGLSGVGYALFGFGWLTRRRYPEFTKVVSDQTIQIFLVWGVICVLATYMKVMNIGNVAHAGGLAFGAAVGASITVPGRRPWFATALALLLIGSVVPLFWSPLSMDWVAARAEKAHEKKRYAEAIRQYRRAMDLGASPRWGWYNIALIYGQEKDRLGYKMAIERLEGADYDLMREVIEIYGEPK